MTHIQRFFSFAFFCAAAALTMQPATSFSEEKAKAKTEESAKLSPSDPVAKVNGVVITRGEIDRAMKVFLAQNRSPQQPSADQLQQLQDAALEQMISAEMLYQAGTKLDMKDVEKQAEEKITQSRARFPSQAEFEAALKNSGLDEKELKELTRKDIIINNLVEREIASKITISEKDAEKFYNENLSKFKQEESVKASHILVGVDAKAGEEDKKKARAKADDLLKKIKAGEDFAALAKANSTCPSSAQGGDLGYFGKGQMVPAFEKAAFGLKPGEVSDVVETQFGYHIIKLTEKKNGETAKFEDVKVKIQEYLKNQKIQQSVADYLNELKGKMKVEKLASK